jgi:hypothetical protein
MRFKPFIAVASSALIIGLAACSSGTTTTQATAPPAPQALYAVDLTTGKVFVYALPATAASTPTVTVTTGFTDLYDAVFDSSGTLWVVNDLNPSTLYGYTLPLTSASVPAATINTVGTNNAFGFTFDPTGNLWLGDESNNRLLGYHGPFTGTSTPASFANITVPSPWNAISDTSGDLYVAAGTNVGILNAPPTAVNVNLSTLKEPIPMQLDASGNLYVGDFNTGNLYRYNAPITNAATPAITDLKATTTLKSPYFIALDRSGNLYVSDCSSSIKVFATATFSATSAPEYVLPLPVGAACSTGLAVR